MEVRVENQWPDAQLATVGTVESLLAGPILAEEGGSGKMAELRPGGAGVPDVHVEAAEVVRPHVLAAVVAEVVWPPALEMVLAAVVVSRVVIVRVDADAPCIGPLLHRARGSL